METAVQNRRLNWLDVMKLLCILGVYCNHSSAGPHYMALFAYINGAFFFCSGYVASHHHARNFRQFARDKFVAIFWPYTTFALLTLAVRSRLTEVDLADFFKSFLYGSRSYCCSITFWFLPCLFVMTLYYYGISRAVKNKYGVLALCFALSCAVKILHEAPVLPWGLDMAARYLIYYALGDFLAHHGAALPKRARYAAMGAGCTWAMLTLRDAGGLPQRLLGQPLPLVGQYLQQFVTTLSLIAVLYAAAHALQNASLLARLGRSTVILCCCEEISEIVPPYLWQSAGFAPLQPVGWAAILYRLFGAALTCVCIVWPVNRFLPWMVKCPFPRKQNAPAGRAHES